MEADPPEGESLYTYEDVATASAAADAVLQGSTRKRPRLLEDDEDGLEPVAPDDTISQAPLQAVTSQEAELRPPSPSRLAQVPGVQV